MIDRSAVRTIVAMRSAFALSLLLALAVGGCNSLPSYQDPYLAGKIQEPIQPFFDGNRGKVRRAVQQAELAVLAIDGHLLFESIHFVQGLMDGRDERALIGSEEDLKLAGHCRTPHNQVVTRGLA